MPNTWTRVAICIGMIFTILFANPVIASKTGTKNSLKSNSTEMIIASRIYREQPAKGKGYAHMLAHYICVSAKRNHLDSYVLAAVAWQESTFSMSSSGGIGIMQIMPATAHSAFKHSGLKPRTKIADNIEMGARYLRLCATETSRGGYDRMLGRYNGCGPRGGYVRSVLNRASKIRNNTSSAHTTKYKCRRHHGRRHKKYCPE